jgi:nitrite reductase (NADH) small subunit
MTDWITIGTLSDLPKQGARVIESPIGKVAIFRAADDVVFALVNRCPHKNGPLSEGIVHGHKVSCPLHNWVIDLESGEALAPDQGCAPTLPVKRDGEVISIQIKLPAELTPKSLKYAG